MKSNGLVSILFPWFIGFGLGGFFFSDDHLPYIHTRYGLGSFFLLCTLRSCILFSEMDFGSLIFSWALSCRVSFLSFFFLSF